MEAFKLPPPAFVPVQIAGHETVNIDIYEAADVIRALRDGSDDDKSVWAPRLREWIAKKLGVEPQQLAMNQVDSLHSLLCQAHNAIYEHTKKNDGSIAFLQRLIPESPVDFSDGTT